MKTIQELLPEFRSISLHLRGLSPVTVKRMCENVAFFSRQTGIQYPTDIHLKNLQEFFLMGRKERSWSSRTFRTYYMSLRVFFRWLISEGYMAKNYTDAIQIPKLEKLLPKALTEQQALHLLELVYNFPYEHEFQRIRNHTIMACYIFLGLRKNELLRLTLADINLIEGMVFIRQGKGSKDRMVPITKQLSSILENYLRERRTLNYTNLSLFVSVKRDARLTAYGLKHIVDKIKKKTGYAFTIPQLRHTFATLMAQGGCDLASLAEMMGHSDIKTTSIYIHIAANHLRSEIQKHPLNFMKSINNAGTISKRTDSRYYDNAQSQPHQILCKNQFPQPKSNLWHFNA